MPDPRVTALMPLKNYHLPFLEKALGSLHAQTCPLWRLLVVVEPADRAHFERLLAPHLADARITLLANEGRKLSGAFNTGMRHASTPFVAILLSDDMWALDAVQVLHDYVDCHPTADFLHSSRRYVDEADRPISSIYPSRERFTLRDFVLHSPVKHLLCWRRDLALAIGGMDESLNGVGPDDFDFPWTMAERGAVFLAVRECLYVYRDHRESFRLSTHLTLALHEREIRRIMRKHGATPAEIRARVAVARRGYLQQCLFRSAADRALKEQTGYDARDGWREPYL